MSSSDAALQKEVAHRRENLDAVERHQVAGEWLICGDNQHPLLFDIPVQLLRESCDVAVNECIGNPTSILRRIPEGPTTGEVVLEHGSGVHRVKRMYDAIYRREPGLDGGPDLIHKLFPACLQCLHRSDGRLHLLTTRPGTKTQKAPGVGCSCLLGDVRRDLADHQLRDVDAHISVGLRREREIL